MITRYALLKLRTAVREDFANPDGSKKIGTIFFKQSYTGAIEPTMCYFNDSTDLNEFKTLYAANQIYVFANPSSVESTTNCIDWHLIDRELDFELEQLKKLSTNKSI